jgi:hypothetical protein
VKTLFAIEVVIKTHNLSDDQIDAIEQEFAHTAEGEDSYKVYPKQGHLIIPLNVDTTVEKRERLYERIRQYVNDVKDEWYDRIAAFFSKEPGDEGTYYIFGSLSGQNYNSNKFASIISPAPAGSSNDYRRYEIVEHNHEGVEYYTPKFSKHCAHLLAINILKYNKDKQLATFEIESYSVVNTKRIVRNRYTLEYEITMNPDGKIATRPGIIDRFIDSLHLDRNAMVESIESVSNFAAKKLITNFTAAKPSSSTILDVQFRSIGLIKKVELHGFSNEFRKKIMNAMVGQQEILPKSSDDLGRRSDKAPNDRDNPLRKERSKQKKKRRQPYADEGFDALRFREKLEISNSKEHRYLISSSSGRDEIEIYFPHGPDFSIIFAAYRFILDIVSKEREVTNINEAIDIIQEFEDYYRENPIPQSSEEEIAQAEESAKYTEFGSTAKDEDTSKREETMWEKKEEPPLAQEEDDFDTILQSQ